MSDAGWRVWYLIFSAGVYSVAILELVSWDFAAASIALVAVMAAATSD